MRAEHGGGGNGGANGTEAELSDSLRTFGAVLKALREEAGLTQEEFAPRVRYSAAYVAKIEQGKRFPPADLPARAEEVLGPVATKVLTAAAKSLTRRAGLASWFRQWAGIEEEAISLYAYECRAVPGLLQPEGYARAVFTRQLPPYAPEQVEHKVAARLERQRLVTERPNTAFAFIIEQAVLERRVGGVSVTKAVIDHLLDMGSRSNVEIQVMPLHQQDHCGVDGQLYMAETPKHQWFGYTEGHRSSSLIVDPGEVSVLHQRYGKLRSQALDRQATVNLLERMRGAL
ncbi:MULTISPECIES: helix-turn-helix domain-containing protein [Streptomyces]|uniref:Helix-turn-helix protein n=1 Tax=Streptomyces rubrolavendulae TaxID=285473 RepID=A0A1D8FYG4_9ACTN|nr:MULTISPECIES: helix-turn-helix transcriptional regulator [Streptomyces]AOT58239.1 helix-turn-helix protein [Streptomyces rubrolavendulae]UQS28756.1 helix-turn-helix transcriptional regulator [Streptomyces fradiae]